jgi:hypothetical protein
MKTFKSSETLKISILAAAVLASALLTSARADDDCSPIELDKPGGSMEHVVVRDQEQIGSCYAHTSAAMYDAWRFRHGETEASDYENFSSGFEVGQRFKIDENEKIGPISRLLGDNDPINKLLVDSDINGGFVKKLLPYLLKEGTCSQKLLDTIFDPRFSTNVDSYASGIMKHFNQRRTDFHRKRDEILLKYHLELSDVEAPSATLIQKLIPFLKKNPFKKSKRRTDSAIDRSERITKAKAEIEIERAQALKDGIEELRIANVTYLANKNLKVDSKSLYAEAKHWNANEVNTVKVFEILNLIKCDDSAKMKARGSFRVAVQKSWAFGVTYRGYGKASHFVPEVAKASINAELDQGIDHAYPIGIAYCSKVLLAGRKFHEQDWTNDDVCARHASMVIGRRQIKDPTDASKKVCQFKIRNSWGTGACNKSNYHSDWDCSSDPGSVWVDADVLTQAIHDTQTMVTIYD